MQLCAVVAEQQAVAGGEELGEQPELGDGLGLVPHHEAALDHVLDQHHVEGGQDGRVGLTPQLGDLNYGLVGVSLRLLHEARLSRSHYIITPDHDTVPCTDLHAVHHRHEVHEDAEVLPRHPDELVRLPRAGHVLVTRPLGRRDRLQS